ncbi:MAG: type II CRISPR-associated endonuclease Cas1 [Candidatus Gastranaerophilales bacterium]|nr:type II CRISPR-associated endonuclease Cas1 [Candidatus Gastranaerophilales bacterium]
MSYHILHLTTPNCKISVNKGLLMCDYKDNQTNIIPLADVKSIVVATFGIVFTNNALAKLLENNVVILHCNNSYTPVGFSIPLDRIIKPKVFYNQITRNEEFERKLWNLILKRKVLNQYECLDLIGNKENNLLKLINKPLMNEANIARQYWQNYFIELGKPMTREHQNAQNFENICLNYAYAILNSLIYRSILIHGLIPTLGLHHSSNYKSTPLVYDLMEPYRPFADYYFYIFSKEYEEDFDFENTKLWFKYFSNCIKNYRININNYSYKIVDSIDIYIEKIAKTYCDFDCEKIFLPSLKEQKLLKDTQENRENEE